MINIENFTVYKHTSPSNKVYIGITCRKPIIRWNNGNGYRNNMYFWNAIQKYGWDNFQHEIIAENLSKENACEMEEKLISEYNSNDRNYGYNISSGGEFPGTGCTHIVTDEHKEKMRMMFLGRTIPKEQRIKISNTLKGRTLSQETIRKLSEVKTGTKLSDETKKKISEKKSGRKWSENERNALGEHLKELHKTALPKAHEARRIRVKNLNTGEIFNSVIEASKYYNVNPSNITRCCKGDRKRCGGFEWEYYKERNDK